MLKNQENPFVLLETSLVNKENKSSYLFSDFSDILVFRAGDDLEKFLAKMQGYHDQGMWLSGYFSYEFGYFLDPVFKPMQKNFKFPLAWVGVCQKPKVVGTDTFFGRKLFCQKKCLSPFTIKNIKPNLNRKDYQTAIKKIKGYLEQGLTYQVNYTFKLKFDFSGDALSFYQLLKKNQKTSYSAFIDTGSDKILSLSPELFFRINGKRIFSRPMKGTVALCKDVKGVEKNKHNISKNKKILAENLMIVDLLRNDLGRISDKVWVEKMFNVEKYSTLYQMTSTINANLKKDSTLKEIFTAIFPCGSVTGAPKIKTMQLIKSLEKEPRKVYTGAIGYIGPNNKTCFNVAIRTAIINKNKGELGIGGGIVYDSSVDAEYKEALLKAKFFLNSVNKG